MTEDEILAEYSTPSLRRNELTRSAKKEHLNGVAKHLTREERDKILEQLYGQEAGDGLGPVDTVRSGVVEAPAAS